MEPKDTQSTYREDETSTIVDRLANDHTEQKHGTNRATDDPKAKKPKKKSGIWAGLVLALLVVGLVVYIGLNTNTFSKFVPDINLGLSSSTGTSSSQKSTGKSATYSSSSNTQTADSNLTDSLNSFGTIVTVLAVSVVVTALSSVIIVVALLGMSGQISSLSKKIDHIVDNSRT